MLGIQSLPCGEIKHWTVQPADSRDAQKRENESQYDVVPRDVWRWARSRGVHEAISIQTILTTPYLDETTLETK
jgi:hypothetical protein